MSLKEIEVYLKILRNKEFTSDVRCIICPSHVYLESFQKYNKNRSLILGGQDISEHLKGSYTGENSASMLKDVGCEYTLIGHYERKVNWKENQATILKKIKLALESRLKIILCISDLSLDLKGIDIDLLKNSNSIIAYEPSWAISKNVELDISYLKKEFDKLSSITHNKVPLVYGGAVTIENSGNLLQICDGLLVGRQSLDAENFCKIVNSL